MEQALPAETMGIFSSLQPQNVRLRRAIRNLEAVAAHPLYPILFDSQSIGGVRAMRGLLWSQELRLALTFDEPSGKRASRRATAIGDDAGHNGRCVAVGLL